MVNYKNPDLRQGFSECLLERLLPLEAGTGGVCRTPAVLSLPSKPMLGTHFFKSHCCPWCPEAPCLALPSGVRV